MIPSKESLTDAGLELLLYQFQGKANIQSLLESYLGECDDVLNDLYTLVSTFNIDDATGVYLDYIGNLVGVKRDEDDDDTYRTRIRVQVKINNSKGTPNELLDILSELTSTDNVRLWEHFPVGSVLYTDGKDATLRTLNALNKSAPITSDVVLVVDTTRAGFVGTELLPNYKETPKQHILAELLEQFDFLIDEIGDNIVDEVGDNLILLDSTGNTVSYYGIFNEVIT